MEPGKFTLSLLSVALEDIEHLIEDTIASSRNEGANRWRRMVELARQGEMLCRLHTQDAEPIPAKVQLSSGDQQFQVLIETVAPLLAIASEKNLTDLRRAKADELEALVRMRATFTQVGEGSTEINDRIAVLKQEVLRAA